MKQTNGLAVVGYFGQKERAGQREKDKEYEKSERGN
jgi:hypothetical protein